jgi:hypothetical protein
VADVGSTTAARLKAAAEDGKITTDEAKQIKDEAYTRIRTLIPAESSKVATKVIADLDVYINSKIEEEVAAGKKQGA